MKESVILYLNKKELFGLLETKEMLSNYGEITVIIFMFVATSIGGSSACPSGCICRGSPEQRDTAVCYKPWPHRNKPVTFDEPITSIEFRHLLFQDLKPYLSAARHVSNMIIYPSMKSSNDNPLPEDLFKGMEKLEALTLHPTVNRLAPAGLGKAMKHLTKLKKLDLVGNTIHCDCTLPETIASQEILLLSRSHMPAVKGCKHHGFPADVYNVNNFLEICAERGGYKLTEPSAEGVPRGQVVSTNRKFGNIRDKNLFKVGVKHTRINSNLRKPSAAKLVPGAFSGALGKPPSGDLRQRGPGEKWVLLPGAISGRARISPAISASGFASRFNKARQHGGKWGRRRLLSFEEDGDSDPVLPEAIAKSPGEGMRQRREASTPDMSKKRQPVKVLSGMTTDVFISAQTGRHRDRRSRKNKNGWTRLSGGLKMRAIRSVGGDNTSDSTSSGTLFTPTGEEMQQSREAGSQEVSSRRKRNFARNQVLRTLGRSRGKPKKKTPRKNPWANHWFFKNFNKHRGKRAVDGEDSNDLLGDDVSKSNRTEYPLTEDTSSQRPKGNDDEQNVNEQLKKGPGKPKGAARLRPKVEVTPRRHRPGQEQNHHHREIPGERARQLAVYQLPMNDLTVKLNPFDPFEVDLFFQYILHNENLRGYQEPPHP